MPDKKVIDGDLHLSEDREFDQSLTVKGSVTREPGTYPNLTVDGHLTVEGSIDARQIDADGDLRYYARCFAYKNVRYGGTLDGRRTAGEGAADPVALDGTVEKKEETEDERHECPACGHEHRTEAGQ